MRWSITGTTISAVHSCCAVSESVPSGSNLRLSTTVDSRPIASVKCAKPQEWNIGAAIIVRSRARSGIRSSSAATGSSDCGCLRLAPFGVPVVPEVRISALPCSGGGDRSDVSPRAISSSSVRSPPRSLSGSCHAMKRLRPRVASSRTSANSSSKMIATGSSRSATSASCGPENAVFMNSALAPSLFTAT